jgi:hypothetical protein
MDQWIIATFKAYYMTKKFEQATAKTTEDDAVSLTKFWKNYNMRHATENIHHAWQQITANNMHGMWKRILPHFANSSDFKEESVIEEITNIGRVSGLHELENDDVRELLKSHLEEVTDDNLLLLDQQRVFEDAENDTEEQDNVQVTEFTLKEFVGYLSSCISHEAKKLWMLTSTVACKFVEMCTKHSASTSVCMKI